MSEIYSYIRVSTKDQNEDRQIIALSACNIPKKNMFLDKQSGKDFKRPAYQKLLKKLKPGDLLIVGSIDRLGRNYEEILEQWRKITKEIRADIRVLDMPLLDTSVRRDLTGTLIADIVLQLLSYVAQSERENIRKRQAEGIAAAKARGVRFGRAEAQMPPDFEEWFSQWRRQEITSAELAHHCGVHVSTIYCYARKRGLMPPRQPRNCSRTEARHSPEDCLTARKNSGSSMGSVSQDQIQCGRPEYAHAHPPFRVREKE